MAAESVLLMLGSNGRKNNEHNNWLRMAFYTHQLHQHHANFFNRLFMYYEKRIMEPLKANSPLRIAASASRGREHFQAMGPKQTKPIENKFEKIVFLSLSHLVMLNV